MLCSQAPASHTAIISVLPRSGATASVLLTRSSSIRRIRLFAHVFTNLIQEIWREVGVIRPHHGVDVTVQVKAAKIRWVLERLKNRPIQVGSQINQLDLT